MSLRFLPLLCAALALTLAAPPSEATTEKQAHKPKAAQAKREAKSHAKRKAEREVQSQPLGEREALRRFSAELAASDGFDEEALLKQLAKARVIPLVQRLMMPPPAGTAKDWAAYRARFIEPRRLQAGLAFWDTHAEALARAEQRFGVPAELVAGLIGVETFYGQITGNFRVIDALATLTFEFPKGRRDRSAFFRGELAEFLKLTRREGLDPFSLKGSYAGAMGWPQFMPGSWNRHAIDFDGDGRVDLINSPVDAIGSVAHYLAQHGWQPGMPTHYTVAAPVDTADRARLLAPDILPSFTPAQFAEAGAELSEGGREHPGPLALVELQNGSAAPSYVAGTSNFYALTRYNWSSYYAMAVIGLGRELRRYRMAAKPS